MILMCYNERCVHRHGVDEKNRRLEILLESIISIFFRNKYLNFIIPRLNSQYITVFDIFYGKNPSICPIPNPKLHQIPNNFTEMSRKLCRTI